MPLTSSKIGVRSNQWKSGLLDPYNETYAFLYAHTYTEANVLYRTYRKTLGPPNCRTMASDFTAVHKIP